MALVHDYIKEYGGAERVLEALHDMYPSAPIFTLVYCPEFLGPHRKRFSKWDIKTSPLNDIPFKERFISIYRLIAPWVFKIFNFSGYEVIIVSATGAYSPNMINKKNAKQICYCHTPPRYLYGYATAREWKKIPFLRILAGGMNHILRMVDFWSSQNVDIYIANSEEVRARIQKFYRKDALVIYPPVDVVGKSTKKENYFIAGGRLARPKHFDLIINTANEANLSVKIFGKGFARYGEELYALAGSTVEFVGEITDEEKLKLMSHAQAFIMASGDEDFGIVPVEAMGVGTPVIAYKSGGLKETVIDGKTGVFFESLTAASLGEAIKRFKKLKIKPEDCILQAKKFSKEHFEKGIEKVVKSV